MIIFFFLISFFDKKKIKVEKIKNLLILKENISLIRLYSFKIKIID
jgi:hypothetical protein